MGFKHKIKKDIKNRVFFNKNEFNCILLKYFNNIDIDMKYKYYLYYKFLKKFHLNSSSARIVNRCVMTGRANWSLRMFRLSRISFKEFADNSFICGVRRATW
jgi:ribosomal protein S14